MSKSQLTPPTTWKPPQMNSPTVLIERMSLRLGGNNWRTMALCINNMLQSPGMCTESGLVFYNVIGNSPRNNIVQPQHLTAPPNVDIIFQILNNMGIIDSPIPLSEHDDGSTYRVFLGTEDEKGAFDLMSPSYFVIKTRFTASTSVEEDFFVGCTLHGSTYYALVGASNVPVADIGNGLDALFTDGGRRNFIKYLQDNVRIEGARGFFEWPTDGSVYVPIVINSGGVTTGPWNRMTKEEITSFFYPIQVGHAMNNGSNVSSTIQVLSISTSARDGNIMNGRVVIVSSEEGDNGDAKWLAERNVKQRQV